MACDQDPPMETVRRRDDARKPATDPTLGMDVPLRVRETPPRHRLVALGDSLTAGFQHLALFNTDLSYPALIARELGCYESFVHPTFGIDGGLPLNLEFVARRIDSWHGANLLEAVVYGAPERLAAYLETCRQYWDSGPGSQVPKSQQIMHNLAVPGYDVRDLFTRTADTEWCRIVRPDLLAFTHPFAVNAGALMGLYVLDSARDADGRALTPVGAARRLGDDGGIETLIVFIGANNALRAVTTLCPHWSQEPGYARLDTKDQYNVWQPEHFRRELDILVREISQIDADHVIWGTVPHVTIAPIAHGVGGKPTGSRYFNYYTRPWIEEGKFRANVDTPNLTGDQTRAIDSAIDDYNDAIEAAVCVARRGKRDWRLLDTCGFLDRLAYRRYIQDDTARPEWWTQYTLPDALAALDPQPNTLFFSSDAHGRSAGGLFGLDGVHPTTIGYGLLAQEFVRVIEGAGVKFYDVNGKVRNEPIGIDFAELLKLDTLMSAPPVSIKGDVSLLGWLNREWDWVSHVAHHDPLRG